MSRRAEPGRGRVVVFVALQLAGAAGALLAWARGPGTGVAALIGVPSAAVVFFTLAWLSREDRGVSGGRILGLGLLGAALATVGWFFVFAVVASVVRGADGFATIGVLMGPLLGSWTAGSMAMLQIWPFVPKASTDR